MKNSDTSRSFFMPMTEPAKEKALISACLIGQRCRYDGKSAPAPNLGSLIDQYELVPVCPEVDGGLSVPRAKSWIKGGAGADVWRGQTIVTNELGQDVTGQFKAGAKMALVKAQSLNIKKAILKARSPSCGAGQTFNDCGSTLVEGNGVAAELLIQNGLDVTAI
jgi:uncharacterized protein YbbK (DUF523 family)